MKDRFLVCNVGWMDEYDGLGKGDSIHGGAGFVRKNKWGSEIYNFRVHKGRVYGGLFPGRFKNATRTSTLATLERCQTMTRFMA